MSPDTLAAAFTGDKLAKLSDDQAMRLTPKHLFKMDKTQRQAMTDFTQKAGFDVPKADRGSKVSICTVVLCK